MDIQTTKSARGTAARWLWLLSATGVLLAGCGGGDGAEPEAAPAPAAGGAGPAPAPGPAPGTPAPAPAPAPSPSPPPPLAALAITDAGVPEGLPTRATLGPAGGTLASSDGRLTISVPAGALASATTIDIQPVTATAPGALGSGYQLTPEGVTFAQPVTLIFSYPEDDGAANAADLMRVATRDSRGYWSVVDAAHDAAQRTLRVQTTHFSQWSYVGGLQILPASATVRLDQQQFLTTVVCGAGPDPANPSAPPVLRQCRDALLAQVRTPNWSVNGIAGGNATVGTVNSSTIFGNYRAPGAVPAQNPVAVSAQVDDPAGRATLVSNIRVVDYVTVFEGTASGGFELTALGAETYGELHANLRFTYNENFSVPGRIRHYDGTGTAHARARPFGCDDGAVTVPVSQATLVIHDSGPLAGTYQLGVGALATTTYRCGDPPRQPLDLGPPVAFTAAGSGGAGPCPDVSIGSNPSRLSGSWSCDDRAGNLRGRANWTLRAVQ